jgi:hypothetical protein
MSLILAMTILTAAPLSAGAFHPFGGACGGDNAGEAVACKNDEDAIASKGPQELLLKITRIVAYIAGALAIIVLIVSAIRFITAGSDVSTGSRTDTDIEEARRGIAGALIGLAVIVLAQVIIAYVIRRL